jgi:hypothetical protein
MLSYLQDVIVVCLYILGMGDEVELSYSYEEE